MIFIPGNVPSLKNSKVKTSKGIFPSKTFVKYLRSLNIQGFSSSKKIVKGYSDTINRPNLFAKAIGSYFDDFTSYKFPVLVGMHFVRGSKHKFDFDNAVSTIQDLLSAHDFIPDDSSNYFLPYPLIVNEEYWSYNKEHPGVYLKIHPKHAQKNLKQENMYILYTTDSNKSLGLYEYFLSDSKTPEQHKKVFDDNLKKLKENYSPKKGPKQKQFDTMMLNLGYQKIDLLKIAVKI